MRGLVLTGWLLLGLMSTGVSAAPAHCPDVQLPIAERPVVVGTKFTPPFVMGAKQSPDGLSIDLWRLIADCFDLGPDDYRFVEYGTAEALIEATAREEVHLSIAALSIRADREEVVDFSHPYFEATLGTLVADRDRTANFMLLLERLFQSNILPIVLGLLVFMLAIALYYWWAERRSGNEFFEKGPLSGLYNSMIWAALLVFQGRGEPFALKTRAGQLIMLALTFFGVTIVSSFTAIIASSLTLQALEPTVSSVADLENRTVGVITQSVASGWAADNQVVVQSLQTFPQVQRRFDEAEIDAFLHEREVLEYLVGRKILTDVRLAPLTMLPEEYGVAFPEGSPLREPVNRALLAVLDTPFWPDTVRRYLRER